MARRIVLFLGMIVSLNFLSANANNKVDMEQKQQVIILLGPPGSGKGTQATRVTKELNIPHISTGDLFRANIKNSTDLGKKAQEYMNAGKLVPDSLVLDMLYDRIKKEDCAKGYLLDGFPRTIAQAEAFKEKTKETSNYSVINLSVADGEIVKRITGRLMCKGCQAIYHKSFSPPAKVDVCDSCDKELYQRDDDKVDVVKERLSVYHKQTAPLTSFYKKSGAIVEIDGTKKTDEVFNQIMEATSGVAVH